MRAKSKHFTLGIFSLALALLVPYQVFGAAPKAGATCSKLGTKTISAGLTYTCIKSGKKLVWSKGVKVVAPAPAPTKSESPSNPQDKNPIAVSGNATIGEPCTTKGDKGSIPNGTAICNEVNGKLVWQHWMPDNQGNNSGNSNNNSGGGAVTLGSPCPSKGQTGPIPNGTAVCATSAGKLIWLNVSTQPVPTDGVWIYEGSYNGQSTSSWNTDLPPTAWNGEPTWFQSSWDIPTTVPLAPKCTSNTPLTNYITDPDGIESITPQGFMQPGSHALPVPHMYYNAGSTTAKDPNGVAYKSKIVDMYAPADMTLYGAAKLTYTMADGYQYSEWMMTWHFCGTYWMFNAHVGWIDPGVQAAIDAAPVKNCQKGGQLNTNSQDCYSSRFAYKVKAGTLYAKSSGRAHGFDFGFTDASAPISTRINPTVFAPRWAAGLCHINYYPTNLRAKLEAKLVGNNGCGQLVSDVVGTAQGVWLATGANKYSVLEDYHIALVKHWSDKNLLAFSIGWNAEVPGISGGVFTFTPSASGPNNKAFTEVKSGETMCYDNLLGTTRDGTPAPTIYIKMTGGDTEKLTIAKGTGACGAGPYTMPASSQTFERKVK